MSESPVKRIDLSLCRRPVRWATARLVPWCPAWLAPEAIALSSLAFSIAAAIAFYLASFALSWLWVAALLLVARSVADCLDGEIARLRGLASEHGMFLDILLDDLSFTAMFLGLACATYANFAIIAVAALVYLLNDIMLNLRIHFLRRHEIPVVSPVEICAMMVLGCALTFFFPQALLSFRGEPLGWFDLLALFASAYGIIEFSVSARRLYLELIRAGR
jgi:phosphatidylglycerophosphate synthase